MMNTGWKTGLLALLLLAGCGEISYKRGANGDDLAADQQRCRASPAGDFGACMAARGWTTYRPGSMLIDEPGAAPAPDSAAKPDAAQSGGEPLLLAVAPSKDNRDPKPAGQAKPAVQPFDPHAMYSVSSWWKRGGGRDDLETSAAACSAKLGEPHKLVPREGGGHSASALLIRCLKEYGWYGLGMP